MLSIPLLLLPLLGSERIEQPLQAELAALEPGEELTVLVEMSERYDNRSLIRESASLREPERAPFVEGTLRPFAEESQAALIAVIDELLEADEVSSHHMLWVVNAHVVTGTRTAIERLADVAGVASVRWDEPFSPEYLDAVPRPGPLGPPPREPLAGGGVVVTPPFVDSFEAGVLGPEWTDLSTGAGQVQVTQSFGPPTDGLWHLALDSSDGSFAIAATALTVDFSGVEGAVMTFDLRTFGDATSPSDGVFLRIDGQTVQALALPSGAPYATYQVDLGLAAVSAGVGLDESTEVGFGWANDDSLPNEGFAIDHVRIDPAPAPDIPPTPNVQGHQADQLWEAGFEGSGVLIVNADSGTANDHPALAGQIWSNPNEDPTNGLDDDGNGFVDDGWGWDFLGNDNHPYDGGHGTNTAGIVMGNGANNGGVKTGMAPMATMAVTRLSGESSHMASVQYAIDIGADVVTSSHSYKYPNDPMYHLHRQTSEAALAAGILHSNSIGNQGGLLSTYPIPYNVSAPGICPSPWRHPQQTQTGAVAAVTAVAGILLPDDSLYVSSGQGPSAWEDVTLSDPSYPHAQNPAFWDYPYLGGSQPGLLKPDIACYTQVETTSGSTGYTSSFGGTSAATPHMGGAFCLLSDVNGTVPPRQVARAIQETAVDLGGPGKDLRFGAGKLQVYDAAKRIYAAPTFYPPEVAVGGSTVLDLTGPAGQPYFLVVGFLLGTAPLPIGVDLGIVGPVAVTSGTHTGFDTPTQLLVSLADDPQLSGLQIHVQLVTDDTLGATAEWLASVVETLTVL